MTAFILSSFFYACSSSISTNSIVEEETLSTNESDSLSIDEGEEDPEPQRDYAQTGSYSVLKTSGTASVSNCDSGMEYMIFTPQNVSNPTLLILGHGFLRGGDKMYGWAEHYASWGVEVLAPTLCHYNILTGVDHERNAQNMVELATQHGTEKVIYAGQSAGGLAAIIAASQDSHAIGVLGLDATDTQDAPGVPDFIGRNYASLVSVPSYALAGEPSTCNSNNNGVTLFEMMDTAQVLRVTSSDHCDYEQPTDWACETLCLNDSNSFEDTEIASVIAHLSTAAILALAEDDSNAASAWQDDNLSTWISRGLVDRIR